MTGVFLVLTSMQTSAASRAETAYLKKFVNELGLYLFCYARIARVKEFG